MRRLLQVGVVIAAGAVVLLVASSAHDGGASPTQAENPHQTTVNQAASLYDLPAPIDPKRRLWPDEVPSSYPSDREAAASMVRDAIWDPVGIRWQDLVAVACRDGTYREFLTAHDVALFQARYPMGKEVYLLELGAPTTAVSRWESDGENAWDYTLVWPTEHPEVAGVAMELAFRTTGNGWCYAGPEYVIIYGRNHADMFTEKYQAVGGG